METTDIAQGSVDVNVSQHECKCDLRTKLVGDGCATCNPKLAAEIAEQNKSDEPWYDPEDCEECGCKAGEFGDEDWDCGCYKCPECGQTQ